MATLESSGLAATKEGYILQGLTSYCGAPKMATLELSGLPASKEGHLKWHI